MHQMPSVSSSKGRPICLTHTHRQEMAGYARTHALRFEEEQDKLACVCSTRDRFRVGLGRRQDYASIPPKPTRQGRMACTTHAPLVAAPSRTGKSYSGHTAHGRANPRLLCVVALPARQAKRKVQPRQTVVYAGFFLQLAYGMMHRNRIETGKGGSVVGGWA